MRTDPWKFESIWKSEKWFDNDTLTSFLASTGTLYISDKVIDSPDTYFVLNAGTVELWDNGVLIANWDSIAVAPPGGMEGQLMGLLCLTYAN